MWFEILFPQNHERYKGVRGLQRDEVYRVKVTQ